jgi:DNA/RNA endonuclease G (NUC1)
MYEPIAKALTLADDLFRCGVPHFRERRLIPIRTSAHFIVFDVEKKSPLYTMLKVCPDDETVVKRKDNFTDGFITLPDELCTTESDYAQWNRENPNYPYDKGHSAGSQYRRGNQTEQSDIDALAGVCPEAPAMNRNIKGPLESAILERSKQCEHTYVVQGPVWGADDDADPLPGGQWIPGKFFVSALFIQRKKSLAYVWTMNNLHDKDYVNLHEVSLDSLEEQTGLYLWSNVASDKFNERRDEINGDDWWKKGQPNV